MKEQMLLHICCAPCSTYVLELLRADYDVTGFFYNPNIHPASEYQRRENEMKKYAHNIGIKLICGEYENERWFDMVKGLENEPEGGKRCSLCFHIRLSETAKYAKEHGYNIITTTLSISPHKNAILINQIGDEVSKEFKVDFYSADFKKRGGFEKSIKMSKESGLYRQSYCGCIFSKKSAEEHMKKK